MTWARMRRVVVSSEDTLESTDDMIAIQEYKTPTPPPTAQREKIGNYPMLEASFSIRRPVKMEASDQNLLISIFFLFCQKVRHAATLRSSPR